MRNFKVRLDRLSKKIPANRPGLFLLFEKPDGSLLDMATGEVYKDEKAFPEHALVIVYEQVAA
jgi:hypothetical protein